MAERRLGVEVNGQHTVAVQRGGVGEMQGDGGFAGTALEVGNRRADRPLARGAFGHQRLAFDLQLAPQFVDLFQCVPPLAAVFLDQPFGQRRVGGKASAKGRRVDLEDQLGDLPA